MKKKSLFLAFSLLGAMLTITSCNNAKEATTTITNPIEADQTFEYKLTDTKDSYSIIRLRNLTQKSITIPSEYKGLPVERIEDGVFSENNSITEIEIPASIKTIHPNAFYNCDSLKKVTLLEGFTRIDADTFADENDKFSFVLNIEPNTVEELVLPNSLKEIGDNAFLNSSFKSINLPEGLETIEDYAFSMSNLTEITIPENIKSLGENVFDGCESLKKVNLPSNLEKTGVNEFKDCTALEEIALPNTLTEIAEGTFKGCTSLKDITIPSSVKTIGKHAFDKTTSLEEINLPDGLESLGKFSFDSCESLKTITIPSKITSLSEYTFFGCKNLESIVLPKSLTNVEKYTFSECEKLSKVYFMGTDKSQITVDTEGNTKFMDASFYYFTENGASEASSGNFWYYDTDGVTIIEKVI